MVAKTCAYDDRFFLLTDIVWHSSVTIRLSRFVKALLAMFGFAVFGGILLPPTWDDFHKKYPKITFHNPVDFDRIDGTPASDTKVPGAPQNRPISAPQQPPTIPTTSSAPPSKPDCQTTGVVNLGHESIIEHDRITGFDCAIQNRGDKAIIRNDELKR